MESVRLGFVGAGRMGQQAHLANYADLPGVRLVALAEGRPRLAARVAARYGVEEVCRDHRELAARDDIDAVVCIVPYALHYGIVPDLLVSGKHVATEKAVSVTQTAGEGLVSIWRESGRIWQVSYMKRFDPAVARARELIAAWRESGVAGALQYVRIWVAHSPAWVWGIEPHLTTDEPLPDYYLAPEPAEPGADVPTTQWVFRQINYYSHQTNLLRYLLDEGYTPTHHDRWSSGDVISARSESGVRLQMEFARFQTPGWDEGFDVRFESATLRCALPAPLERQQAGRLTIERVGERPTLEQPWFEPVWAMRAQAEAFVAAVRGEAPCLSPPDDALEDVRLWWRLAQTAPGPETG